MCMMLILQMYLGLGMGPILRNRIGKTEADSHGMERFKGQDLTDFRFLTIRTAFHEDPRVGHMSLITRPEPTRLWQDLQVLSCY